MDVYVTYRCNLRCTHCFVGENLSTAQSFSYDSLTRLIAEARQRWQTEEITFLGGEPTLYPRIADAVHLVQRQGLRARLVTNGLHGFRSFVDRFDGANPPVVGVSIDGSGPETHDAVRGKRAFERLVANVAHARERGYQLFGITSVSGTNAHDAVDTLRLCERLGLTWVNVHYVSNRGFATPEMVLSIPEWQALTKEIEERSADLAIDIRLERTFVPAQDHRRSCAVRSHDNLLFLPDGRVFQCPMFIDVPDAHSYTWSGSRLVSRPDSRTEAMLCSARSSVHCPALRHVNPQMHTAVAAAGLEMSCVLEKTRLSRGLVVDDE
ncbi:radical SAM protein [Streptomyces sp. NPDC057002]|uniref:radical SAM protein n=1 Tax=Streptomyces sp. NPDC057002 TaxID=3345992 RepID=UPI0036428976